MNYATGAAFNLDNIVEKLNLNKLKVTQKECLENNGDEHRRKLCKKIFREALKLILNDIIDNNITFELPTTGRPSSFYVKRTQGEDFIKARRKGKWQDVDFIESNWSGYQLSYSMKTRNTTFEKPIYLDRKLKNKLTENVNKGKQYC